VTFGILILVDISYKRYMHGHLLDLSSLSGQGLMSKFAFTKDVFSFYGLSDTDATGLLKSESEVGKTSYSAVRENVGGNDTVPIYMEKD